MSLSRFAAITLLAGAILIPGCKKSAPANVAATVNNRAITYDELERQYKLQYPQRDERISESLLAYQKLEILRSMIDNEIMLQRAEKLGLMAVDSDVTAKFNELKAPYTQEEFQRQLDARNMTVEELKSQLRRDLSIQKLFNKEITSHITISDKDVSDFYNANKAAFNLAEPQVHIAQLVVTPTANPNARNLKGDVSQNDEQARKKIQMIEARLRQGEDFAMLAQNYSEDPNTAPNGGDLGYIPESALEKADVELRKVVMTLQPGQISPILHTQTGYRILKLISREPAGQRELEDPRVQQTIRETIMNRKDQLLRNAYYEVARGEAQVCDYYAQSIIEQVGGKAK